MLVEVVLWALLFGLFIDLMNVFMRKNLDWNVCGYMSLYIGVYVCRYIHTYKYFKFLDPVKLLDLSYLSHSVFIYLSYLSQFNQMVTILAAFNN